MHRRYSENKLCHKRASIFTYTKCEMIWDESVRNDLIPSISGTFISPFSFEFLSSYPLYFGSSSSLKCMPQFSVGLSIVLWFFFSHGWSVHYCAISALIGDAVRSLFSRFVINNRHSLFEIVSFGFSVSLQTVW